VSPNDLIRLEMTSRMDSSSSTIEIIGVFDTQSSIVRPLAKEQQALWLTAAE
jgi:hypothetical protein